MIFEIVQSKKELFAANFDITRNHNNIGWLHLQGQLGSMEALWNGKVEDESFIMKDGRLNWIAYKNAFRPYVFRWNNGEIGAVYQTEYKESVFSKISFHRLITKQYSYELYLIGFGKEGTKCPVYLGNKQIALIEKDVLVYNDLHSYSVFSIDEKSSHIAVIFSCYMYINACYKPGVKITSSVQRVFNKTNSKLLKSKYDPEFKSGIDA